MHILVRNLLLHLETRTLVVIATHLLHRHDGVPDLGWNLSINADLGGLLLHKLTLLHLGLIVVLRELMSHICWVCLISTSYGRLLSLHEIGSLICRWDRAHLNIIKHTVTYLIQIGEVYVLAESDGNVSLV